MALTPARDADGYLRLADRGELPLPAEIRSYHRLPQDRQLHLRIHHLAWRIARPPRKRSTYRPSRARRLGFTGSTNGHGGIG